MINQSIWVLAAVLTLPAAAAMGQQNNRSNGDVSSHASQSRHEENHAMQTGSPNDNGGGLMGDYGKTQPGKKVHMKHQHNRRSKKYTHLAEPEQSGTRGTDTAHPE